jgi:hypothetical protein
MVKERMSGTPYSSPDELISAISELIASLPKDQLVSVYKNWMKLLNWVIKHRGEYYRKCVKLHVLNCYIHRHRTLLRTF